MAIFKKGSKGYSIVNLQCPRCQEEAAFHTGTWTYSKPFEMKDRCSTCGLNYMPEPGFYYGSMFVSYIIWGWFSIILVGALIIFADMSVEGAFVILILISAFLFVWLFRISRSIWMNINFKYDPSKIKKDKI